MIKRQQKGFTIVELLIVIVVIGVLAAISTVAFNGVQARAENQKTVTGTASLVKALQVYYADNSSYPVGTTYPCLGVVPTTCGVTGGAGCWGVGYVGANTTFNNTILTVITSIPEVSKQTMTCNPDGTKAGGAFYYSTGTGSYIIYYFLKGDVPCGSPAGTTATRAFSVQTTVCAMTVTPN